MDDVVDYLIIADPFIDPRSYPTFIRLEEEYMQLLNTEPFGGPGVWKATVLRGALGSVPEAHDADTRVLEVLALIFDIERDLLGSASFGPSSWSGSTIVPIHSTKPMNQALGASGRTVSYDFILQFYKSAVENARSYAEKLEDWARYAHTLVLWTDDYHGELNNHTESDVSEYTPKDNRLICEIQQNTLNISRAEGEPERRYSVGMTLMEVKTPPRRDYS